MKHKRGILSGIYQGILRSGVRRREVLSRLNRDRTISTMRTSCINQGGKIVWADEGLTTGNPGGFRGSSFEKLEGNIDQSPGNQGQGEGNHRSGIGIPNINHDFSFDRFFNLKDDSKDNQLLSTAEWTKVMYLLPGDTLLFSLLSSALAAVSAVPARVHADITKLSIPQAIRFEISGGVTGKDLSVFNETGQIVPAKIKGLLDMGVKPFYKLTTGDGRSIRTTGNHQYLVRSFSENQDTQKNSDQNQGKSNLNIGAGVENIKIAHNSDLSNLKQIPKQNIAMNISPVKTQYKSGLEKLTKFGVINATVNQAANKLTDNPDKDLTAAFLSLKDNFINNNVSNENYFVKSNEELSFSQDTARITKSNFGIGNRHAGVLAGDVGKSVSSLQKIQNISNCNSRAFNAGLAEPDGLFYDNVHNNNYYSNFSDTVSNSQYEI